MPGKKRPVVTPLAAAAIDVKGMPPKPTATPAATPAPAPAAVARAAPTAVAATASKPAASASESDSAAASAPKEKETLHQIKQRHKQELKDLSNHASVKGKGGNKKLKELEAELKLKQNAEIETFQKQKKAADVDGDADADAAADTKTDSSAAAADGKDSKSSAGSDAAVAGVADGVSKLSVDSKTLTVGPLVMGSGITKQTKAAKKKATKAAKDAARTAELKELNKDAIDLRAVELKQFAVQLAPLRMTIKEIASDGHCLFRAIDHQLTLTGTPPPAKPTTAAAAAAASDEPRYLTLRKSTADYMRSKPDEFSSFMVDENGDLLDAKGFEAYCTALVSVDPVAWGGQHEIAALAKVLNRQIIVHSAKGTPLVMGNTKSSLAALRIAFHEHYFGLGHHYNSVVPIAGGK